MESNGKPSVPLILAGVDFILIGASTVYLTNKIGAINSRIDELEKGKTIKNDSEFIDSINDIYDRVEFLESENEILKQKISRLEHISNKLLFALNTNNIPVVIEQNVRRVIRPRKSNSRSKNSSGKSAPTKQENYPQNSRSSSVSSHDEDEDVLAAVEDARK